MNTPAEAVACVQKAPLPAYRATIDPQKKYSFAELVDIAERNNPQAKIAWEAAKQRAERYGIARAEYLPLLTSSTLFEDQRIVDPFPKPLAPLGYVMVELPTVQPQLELSYLLIDFGGRGGRVDGAAADRLAAGAALIRVHQDIAFRVAQSFYRATAAEGRLRAAEDILKAAQTVQDSAEQALRNGRSTLPDFQNAKAATAQAAYDRENADGEVRSAKVFLREAIGVEPSPEIKLADSNSELPGALSEPIERLVEQAVTDRPDVLARMQDVRAAKDEVRIAKAAYLPSIGFSASGAQTSVWPTASYGQLGSASQPTWSAAIDLRWEIFDRAREHRKAIADSRARSSEEELRESRDAAVREVWNSYIAYHTALRRNQAAGVLVEAATTSYNSSLEAYRYGVKNLIDVVVAQRQLAQAQLQAVQARSDLLLDAVAVNYSVGSLLRTKSSTPRSAR